MKRRVSGMAMGSGGAAGQRRAVAWLVVAAVLAPSLPAAAGAAPATVTGSVKVSRASLKAEGPKDDLDVVLALAPLESEPSPASGATATMDQRGLVFLPHVLAVQTGTNVTFLNNDNDQHNVYFLDDRTGETLDIGTWGPGVSVDHTFTEPGMVITLCKLHLEMAAYVVVVEHPWFTQSRLDPDTLTASFAIDGVPDGEYELTAWHKKLRQLGGARRLSVAGREVAAGEVVITTARYAGGTR